VGEHERLSFFLDSMATQLAYLRDLSERAIKRPDSVNRQKLLDDISAERDKLLRASQQISASIEKLVG
jgi:arginine deiminase